MVWICSPASIFVVVVARAHGYPVLGSPVLTAGSHAFLEMKVVQALDPGASLCSTGL